MANPTGHTYHYGQHDPLAEPGGIGIRYRDEEWQAASPPVANPTYTPPAPSEPGHYTSTGGANAGSATDVLTRYPMASVLAAIGLGFLAGQCAFGCMRRD